MSLQAAFLMLSPCTRTWSTIMLYISSATKDPWPHSLHLSFLLRFLFVSHYQDLFSKTHNHLCSSAYHPETLTCVSSVLLLNVHTWMTVCYLCSFCDFSGSYIVCLCFLNENMVNQCKMMVFLCRVLQKTLTKLERVCKQVKCVKSFRKRVFVSRTVWMVWKIVSKESVIVY